MTTTYSTTPSSTSTTTSGNAAASTPQLARIRTRGTWTGKLGTDITVRDFTFATAEPVPLGGDDSAPTPMEYVVGSFLGCIAVVLELVAKEWDVTIDSLELEAIGTLDRRGFAGTADVSPHFQSLTGTADVETDADEETFRAIIADVERRCPAFNLFRDAGVPPAITWILAGKVLA